MSEFALVLGLKDPKSAVNQFCQRHCARPIGKNDVVYTTVQHGELYQTTIRLNCIDGQEFASELVSTSKDAEKSAAQQALYAFSDEINSMEAKASAGKKKRPGSDGSGGPAMKIPRLEGAAAAGGSADTGSKDPKTMLNQFCQKHCCRPIRKEDVVYTTVKHGISYQTTVKLYCIEGQEFAGELALTPKDAEKSAAQQALDSFPEDLPPMVPPKPKKPEPPPGSTNTDSKTQVNQFCQKYCIRPITRDDVIYTTVKHGNQYQSTVLLNCLDEQTFAGELADTQKEAEQSAAQQVLEAYADKIAAIALRSMAGHTPKVELNTVCCRILRSVMEKGDVTYETTKVEGGYRSTVKLPRLPGDWGSFEWVGDVCTRKKEAEQAAARRALETLRNDPNSPCKTDKEKAR